MITPISEVLRHAITQGWCGCECMPFTIEEQIHAPDCLWNNTILEIYKLEREADNGE